MIFFSGFYINREEENKTQSLQNQVVDLENALDVSRRESAAVIADLQSQLETATKVSSKRFKY